MLTAHDRVVRRFCAYRRSGSTAAIIAVLLTVPSAALAVSRTCGVDPVANTTNVLCAAPSGPCTATAVTMSNDIEVTAGGCEFDLGGRTLSVQKSFLMSGLGFIKVTNAGNITLTGTGRLRARGDFVEPTGVIIQGGLITLTSTGVITLLDRAIIDVSGDGAGTVSLTAGGANGAGVGIDLQATAQIMGQGISSSVDTGDRFADGGSLVVNATGGGIVDNAAINMSSANGAQGGSVDMRSARDITVGEVVDATGGASDGGSIDLLAADNITVTKTLSVDSRLGGGFGGTMTLTAGVDVLGGVVPGGAITINST